MTLKGDFDWIELQDGTVDIYTRDRKIAHIAQGDRGWHVASDPAHQFDDVEVLLRLIDRGQRDGFSPQDR
ncbi:hypothetical protein [Rathayibacter soli]|uniref:hypothetical protein n=1 Tax=Rathayibacter soli TaxID=3144168 RepID=UPI0027E58A9B|nr:hypothetical protein [Glaciibacter superstes]